MKSNLLFLALTGVCLAACNQKNTTDMPVTTMDTVNHTESMTTDSGSTNTASGTAAATGTSKAGPDDSTFLATAHDIGMFEIKAAELAQSKAQSVKVKEFAGMMISDHTTMGSDVEKLAKNKGITLPADISAEHKKKWDKLNSLTGDKFDKEYADINQKGHKDAIEKFEKATRNHNCSPEVQQLASSALPKLKTHKEHADMLTGAGMKM